MAAPYQGAWVKPTSSSKPKPTGAREEPTSMPEYTRPYTAPVDPLGVTRRISMSRDGEAMPEQKPAAPTTNKASDGMTQPAPSTSSKAPDTHRDTNTMTSERGVVEAMKPPTNMPAAEASMKPDKAVPAVTLSMP